MIIRIIQLSYIYTTRKYYFTVYNSMQVKTNCETLFVSEHYRILLDLIVLRIMYLYLPGNRERNILASTSMNITNVVDSNMTLQLTNSLMQTYLM